MQLALLLCTAIYWGQNLRIIFENNPELQVIGHENLRPVGYNKWTSYNQGADGDKMSTYHAITIEVNDERLSDLLVQIHSFNTGLVLGKEKVEFLLVISQMIFGNSLLLLELCAQNKLPMPLLNVDLNQNGLHPTPGAIGDLSGTLLQMLGINPNVYKSYHPPTTGSVFTVHPPPSETPGFMQWIKIIKSIRPQPLVHTVPQYPDFHIPPLQTPPPHFDISLSQPQHSQFIIPHPTPRKPHFHIPLSIPGQPRFEIPLPPSQSPQFIIPHPPPRKPYFYLPFSPPPQPPQFITPHPPPTRPHFHIPLTLQPQPDYKILRPIPRQIPPMVYLPSPQIHLPRPIPSSIYSLPIQRPHPQFQKPEISQPPPIIHYTRPIPQTQSTAVNISKKVTWPHPWLSPPQTLIEHRPLPQIIYKPHRITLPIPRPAPQIWPQFMPAPEPVDIPSIVPQWHKKVIFVTPRPQLVLSTPHPTPVYVPQPQKHVSISVSTVRPSYQIPQWPDLQIPKAKKSIHYITTTRPPVLHRNVIPTHQRPPLRPVQWVELPKPVIHVTTPRPVIQNHVTLIPTPRPQYTPWPLFQPARIWQQPVQITVTPRPTPLHSYPQPHMHISTPRPTPQPGPNSIHITTVQPLPHPQPIPIPHREPVPVQNWEPIPMPIPIPRPIPHFIPEFIPQSIPRPSPQPFILPRPVPNPQVQWPRHLFLPRHEIPTDLNQILVQSPWPQTNDYIKRFVNQPDPMLWPIPQPQPKKVVGVRPEINFTPRPIPQSVREIFITTQRPLPKITLPMPNPRPLPHIQVSQWQPDVEIIKNEMHLPTIPQTMTTLNHLHIQSSTPSPTVIVTSKPQPIYYPEPRPNEISIHIQKTKPYSMPFTQPQPVWIPNHQELPISVPNPVYYPKPMPTKEITITSATVTPLPHPQPKVTILTTPEPQPSFQEVTQIYSSRTEPVHISPEPHWPIPSASPSTIIIPNNAYPTPPTFVPEVPESEVMVTTTQAPQFLGGDLPNHPPQPDDLDNFTVVPTTEIYATLTVTTGTPDKEEHITIHGEDCAHTQHHESPKYIIIQDNKFKLNPVLVSEDLFYYIIENTDNLNPLKYYTPVTYPVNVAPGVTKLKTLVYYILPLQIKDLQQPGTLKIQNFLYIPTNLQSDHFGIEKGDILAPLSNKVDIEKVLQNLVKVVNHKQWITTPSNKILQHWITGNNGEIEMGGLNIFGSAPGFGRGDNHGGEFTIGGIGRGQVPIDHPNTLEGGNNLREIQLWPGGIGTETGEIGFGEGIPLGPEGIVSGPGGIVSGPGGIVSELGVELGGFGFGGGIGTGPSVFGVEGGIESGPGEIEISRGIGSGPGKIKFEGDLPSGQGGIVSGPGFEFGTGGGFGGFLPSKGVGLEGILGTGGGFGEDLQFGKGEIVSGPGFEFGTGGGFGGNLPVKGVGLGKIIETGDGFGGTGGGFGGTGGGFGGMGGGFGVKGGGFVGTGGGFGGIFSGPGGQGIDLGTGGNGFGLGGGIALGSEGIQWGSGGAETEPAIKTGINNIFGTGFGTASSGKKPSKYWISPDILKPHSEIRPPSTLDVQLPKITIPNSKKALNLVDILLRKKQEAASITADNVSTGGGFWKFNPMSTGADGSQNERDSLQIQQVNAGVPQTLSQVSDVTQMSNGLSGMSANVQNDAPVTTYSPSEPSMDEHQQSVTESNANDQESQSDAPNAADSASDAPEQSRTATEPPVSDDLLDHRIVGGQSAMNHRNLHTKVRSHTMNTEMNVT